MSLRSIVLLLLSALIANGATSYQAMISFPELPAGARTQALAVDAAGNEFIIANIVKATGKPQIHVLKIDPQGKTLASIEFGGTAIGAGVADWIAGAAVDAKGNLVIAGTTYSDDFPLVSPLFMKTGVSAAFIVKLDPELKGILFSTKLGGPTGYTSARAFALDQAGNVYITGATSDPEFPTTFGAFQRAPPPSDKAYKATYAFLTELNSESKSLVFSTYFGNSPTACKDCPNTLGYTIASAVAIDAAGSIVIAGTTTSSGLPVTPGVFGPSCGDCSSAPQATAGFLARFSAHGSTLLWATYITVSKSAPSPARVEIATMTLDRDGAIVFAGRASPGLPVLPGNIVPAIPGVTIFVPLSGFVMKLDSSGKRLLLGNYFGDSVTALATDPQGAIWINGTSRAEKLKAPKEMPILGQNYLATVASDGSSLSNIFTVPNGVIGQALLVSAGGLVTAMGAERSLLTLSPGQGPSLIGLSNSAGGPISNAVAPYEMISLYGLGLGPQTAQVSSGKTATSLGGVQVLIDGIPVPLLFAGSTQINAVVPGSVFGQEAATLQIATTAGVLKGPALIIRLSQPQIFTVPGPIDFAPNALARNQDGTLNSGTNPAPVGSVVTVWVSGAGITSGGPIRPVSVFSFQLLTAVAFRGFLPGPLSLEVLNARDAPGMVEGITELQFRLPARSEGGIFNSGFRLQIGDASSDPFTLYVK